METSACPSATSSEITVRAEFMPIAAKPGKVLAPNRSCNLLRDVPGTVYIVDDDAEVRGLLREVLEQSGYIVKCFASGADLLAEEPPGGRGCLLVDLIMPGMSGIELIQRLEAAANEAPVIVISGHADVSLAVEAMKAGARDFLEKPVRCDALLASIERALTVAQKSTGVADRRREAAVKIARLTRKQQQILNLVVAGHPSKNIAADLGISQRTVDNHRAAIMRKIGAKSIAGLIQKVICARCVEDQRNSCQAAIEAAPGRLPAIAHDGKADATNGRPALGATAVTRSSAIE